MPAIEEHGLQHTSEELRLEQIKPRHDWILVRPTETEKTSAGGIVIPDSAQRRQWRGTVLAVGPGRWHVNTARDEVQFVATVARVGQEILFSKYHAVNVTIGKADYWLLPDSDVQAVLEWPPNMAPASCYEPADVPPHTVCGEVDGKP